MRIITAVNKKYIVTWHKNNIEKQVVHQDKKNVSLRYTIILSTLFGERTKHFAFTGARFCEQWKIRKSNTFQHPRSGLCWPSAYKKSIATRFIRMTNSVVMSLIKRMAGIR
jgi:hypothetical protein